MNKNVFPIAKHPGEYVAFAVLPMNTIMDGQVYVFMAVDVYSEFAFHLGIDRNDNPETILKYIYLFTEDPQFKKLRNKGFTLVFEKYVELTDRINAIINGVNGKLLIDKTYNNFIMIPVLKSLSEFLLNDKK